MPAVPSIAQITAVSPGSGDSGSGSEFHRALRWVSRPTKYRGAAGNWRGVGTRSVEQGVARNGGEAGDEGGAGGWWWGWGTYRVGRGGGGGGMWRVRRMRRTWGWQGWWWMWREWWGM